MSEQLYKWTRADGGAAHGGAGRWSLPHDGKPGKWMPPLHGKIVPCFHGYHFCRKRDIVYWPVWEGMLWEAEAGRSRPRPADNKVVGRYGRLTRQIGQLTPPVLRRFNYECLAEAEKGIRTRTHLTLYRRGMDLCRANVAHGFDEAAQAEAYSLGGEIMYAYGYRYNYHPFDLLHEAFIVYGYPISPLNVREPIGQLVRISTEIIVRRLRCDQSAADEWHADRLIESMEAERGVG